MSPPPHSGHVCPTQQVTASARTVVPRPAAAGDCQFLSSSGAALVFVKHRQSHRVWATDRTAEGKGTVACGNPSRSCGFALAQAQLQADGSVRETVTEPVRPGLRAPTSDRPGESRCTPPGHEQGGNSWCPLSGEASSTGVRLLPLASWPGSHPV